MHVIPVVNCPDAECAKAKFAVLKSFYEPGGFVHFDVTDGIFAGHATWETPTGWGTLAEPYLLEAHLMVARPEAHVGPWVAAGAKRLILPVESMKADIADAVLEMAQSHSVPIMLAANPETPVEAFLPYLAQFSMFQILAVHPGPSGQEILSGIPEKIAALRRAKPDAIIEVDGGVNPATARLVKEAGADIIASGSYIFNAPDPKAAYEELKNI